MTITYILLGRIPRNLWAPGDACISPLEHTSMTSCPKWEELARDGCSGVFCVFILLLLEALTYALSKFGKSELNSE